MSLINPFGIREREVKKIIKDFCPDKTMFYSQNEEPCFNTKKGYAIPSSLDTAEANLCGTAFDYAVRFLIAKKQNANKEAAIEYLVAGGLFSHENHFHEITFDVEKLKKYEIFVDKSNVIICGSWSSWLERENNIRKSKIEYLCSEGTIKVSFVKNDILNELKDRFEEFRNSIKDFIYDDTVNNDDLIIEKCIILAKMEQIVRSSQGYVSIDDIYSFNDKYIAVKKELHKLLESFRKIFLPIVKQESEVVFNPSFGFGSWMVGGADADIYIDGTLYDFKVVKKNGWSSKNATQIMGYFILDLFAKECKDPKTDLYNKKIERIALYNVRYAEIDYYDCKNIDKNLLKNAIRRIGDIFILYKVFYLKRHHDDVVEKFSIPLEDDSCLDWNEQHAEELNEYSKRIENGDVLSRYEKEDFEKYTKIKKRITEYIQGANSISIIRELIKKQIITYDNQDRHGLDNCDSK